MKDNDKKNTVTELSTEQQKAIIDTKEVLASKQDVLRELGQIEAFEFINKLATVATLKILAKVKEAKEYVGLTYKLENGDLATVATWDDFCTHILHTPKRTIDDRLLNLNTFGEEFFETSQRIGLGNRDLRKLRQLPSEEQALIINNEAVDLGDKEAVKELIEDYTFSHLTEKAALKKQLDEANQTVEAVRENSAQKQQELDEVKEREAKRRFSPVPWQYQTHDLVQGMLEARVLIEQGVNQLTDVFKRITNPETPLDEKALNYCARSILSEATNVNDLVFPFTNEVMGVLSSTFKADLDAIDVLQELSVNED